MQNIFITKGISLKEKTEEDWEMQAKVVSLKQNKTVEIEYLKQLEESFYKKAANYKISDYNHAYFLDKEHAIESVKLDMGGMNEAGAYEYAAIIELPLETSYPEFGYIGFYEFYKYNHELCEYEILTDNVIRNVLIDHFQIIQ